MTPQERRSARRRDDLAQRLVPKALDLACIVHGDGDADAVRVFLEALAPDERDALPVILAALVPVDVPAGDLLSWVTWGPAGPLPSPSCGTPEGYRAHKKAGEQPDDACVTAMRGYWAARNRQRPARGGEAA